MTGERWNPLVMRMLAPNPGPMTLDGTNSYVVSSPDTRRVIVVDPGPDDAGHLDRLAGAGEVALILLTHHHSDHTDGVAGLAARTRAPVRAVDPALCLGADPLADGDVIRVGETLVRVLATPGHTADSVCFSVAGPNTSPVMLTGDTILGRGTTVILSPDGSLKDYLASLDLLEAQGMLPVLPGHGPMLADLAAVSANYRAHRLGRLDEIRALLDSLVAAPRTSADLIALVTDRLYAGVAPAIRFAAEASVRSQLAYLGALDG